jgi:lysophospholipase L1-like esterase
MVVAAGHPLPAVFGHTDCHDQRFGSRAVHVYPVLKRGSKGEQFRFSGLPLTDMKRIFQNLAVAVAALLLSLLLGEAAVRGLFHFVSSYDYEMWRYAAELKQPSGNRELPFSHRPNRGGRFYGVDIRTNSLGMRDPERPIAKPAGCRRILFLGDSYTLGWGVPEEATFSRQLEQMLAKAGSASQVFNLGVGNYNSAMEVALLKQQGLKLDPDLIVLLYYINDVEPTPELGSMSYWMQKHFYLLGFIRTKVRQLALMGKGGDWLENYYRKLYAADAPGFKQNRQALLELAELCRSRNIRLLMVNIPDLRRLDNYPFQYATTFIRDVAAANGVPFLDLLPALAGNSGKSLWVSDADSHSNARANGLAAAAIFRKISTEALLDAR